MLTIQVPGTSIRWPQVCACCLAPFTHTVTAAKAKGLHLGVASFSRTLTVSVPYCEPCSRHAVWASGHRYAGILLRVFLVLFLAPLLGIAAMALPEGPLQTAGVLFLSCGMPVILAVVVGIREYKKIPRNLDASHTSNGHAVEVVDFQNDSTTLRFHNDQYGRQVAAANGSAVS